MKRRILTAAAAMIGVPLLAVALGLFGGREMSATWADGVHPGLTPELVSETIVPGGSLEIEKTVHTPEIPPTPDIYFLTDSTGSMGPVIAAVQADAAAILAAIDGATTDPRYGAGDYKDFPPDADPPNPYAFMNGASIPAADDDGAAALAAIGAWSAGGGGDGPEGQFYALNQIADSAAAFRPDSERIVVWFGDAPAHDPVCSAISGLGYDIDEASVTAKLVSADIRVVAISVVTASGAFFPNALDDDPTAYAGDYVPACGVENGASGQASRIAAATGGVHLSNVQPADVADAIIEGLEAISVDVSMATDCAPPISVSFDPAGQTVVSGEHAVFAETISVDDLAPQDVTYECDDWALVNGEPMVDPATGEIIKEHKVIYVPDVVPPEAACAETVNPHGQNVPPAGSSTLPGPKGGQNEDGFYELAATDNIDPNPQVFVYDMGSGTVFGPFASGDKIKYTEDQYAVPEAKKMGSDKGKADAIAAHIIGNGDPAVFAVDASGNVSDRVLCLVPPPPK